MGKILIFDPDPQAAELLGRSLAGMGYSAEVVDKKRYGQPLGVLAGENLMGFPTGLNTPPKVPVLVLCHMDEQEVDAVLAALRQMALGKDIFKAILTPTNRFWTISVLAAELEKERAMMETYRKEKGKA